MVNVTNRANVHMRLITLEFTFGHFSFPGVWTEFGSNAGRLTTAAQKHKAFVPGAKSGPTTLSATHVVGTADMGMAIADCKGAAAWLSQPGFRSRGRFGHRFPLVERPRRA
ncbi:hypothetical protein GCM10007937_43900 [Mesorhizobium albiziae]|nr:hypothetical protein GCM10007937_43900 [Mesorhizobium albiziae]